MSGLLATFMASFTGSTAGIGVGGVLSWHFYIKPRMAKAGRRARLQAAAAARPSASQATATTPGFVRNENEVTVTHARYGRVKKAVRL